MNATGFATRYRTLETLGAGGMGVVYRAWDRLRCEMVALKQVNWNTPKSSTLPRTDTHAFSLSLMQEFRTLASLRHPYIVPVYDFGFYTAQQPFFTMQFLEHARPITEAVASYTPEEKVECLWQILHALRYLHHRHILHRDLKPSNILMYQNRVMLVDFGLSIALGKTGESGGTIGYLAPELLEGDPASASSDLYAFGVVAYELFCNRLPFPTTNLTRYLQLLFTETPDLSSLPPFLQPIVSRLLDRDPRNRYANAQEVLLALSSQSPLTLHPESTASHLSLVHTTQFIGREQQFDILRKAVHTLQNTKGGFYLVSGAEGVGKSHLFEEIRIHALVEGIQVCKAQASAIRGQPYGLWNETVARLALQTTLSEDEIFVLSLIRTDLPRLLERSSLAVSDQTTFVDDKRIAFALTQLIEQVSLQSPLLLLLEDLHLADEASLFLLDAVVAWAEQTHPAMLILASCDFHNAPQMGERFRAAQSILLRELNRDEIHLLVCSFFDRTDIPKAWIDFLEQESKGNPLRITELLHEIALQMKHDSPFSLPMLPVQIQPFHQCMLRLSEQILNVLQFAALLGNILDTRLLQTVYPDNDIQQILLEALHENFLKISGQEWQFVSDQIRQGLIQSLSKNALILLHRQAAENLETLYAGQDEYAAQITYHWTKAGEQEKAADWSLRAGRHAASRHAVKEALKLYERAIQTHNPAKRCEALCEQGKIFLMLGNWPDAFSTLHQAYEIVKNSAFSNPSLELEILLALARTQNQLSNLDAVPALLQRAETLCRTTENKEGLVLVLIEWAHYYNAANEFSAAINYVHLALEMSQKVNHASLRLKAAFVAGLVYISYRRNTEAIEWLEQAQSLAVSQHAYRLQIAASNNLGTLYLIQREYVKAVYQYNQNLKIARQFGLEYETSTALANLGYAYIMRGESAYAQSCIARSCENALPRKDLYNLHNNLANLLDSLRRQNHPAFLETWQVLEPLAEQIPHDEVTCESFLFYALWTAEHNDWGATQNPLEKARQRAKKSERNDILLRVEMLQARLAVAQSPDQLSKYLAELQTRLQQEDEPERRALIHFTLWKLDPSRETDRREALQYYQDTYEKYGEEEIAGYLKELTGSAPSPPPPLPAPIEWVQSAPSLSSILEQVHQAIPNLLGEIPEKT